MNEHKQGEGKIKIQKYIFMLYSYIYIYLYIYEVCIHKKENTQNFQIGSLCFSKSVLACDALRKH